MTVAYSMAALRDLHHIGDGINASGSARAAGFLKGLWDACEGLAVMPLRYPLIPRREEHGIRRRPHGDYLIFYVVEGADVQIVRVLHGARDYDRLLFPRF